MPKIGTEGVTNALGSINTDDLQVDIKTMPAAAVAAHSVLTFYDGAVKTASEDSAGQDSDGYKTGILEVNITVVSGTAPTLVITVEISDDDVTYFHNTTLTDKEREGDLERVTSPTDEAQITTVTKHVLWIKNLSKFIRLVLTIAGSSPSFTTTAKITLHR